MFRQFLHLIECLQRQLYHQQQNQAIQHHLHHHNNQHRLRHQHHDRNLQLYLHLHLHHRLQQLHDLIMQFHLLLRHLHHHQFHHPIMDFQKLPLQLRRHWIRLILQHKYLKLDQQLPLKHQQPIRLNHLQ